MGLRLCLRHADSSCVCGCGFGCGLIYGMVCRIIYSFGCGIGRSIRTAALSAVLTRRYADMLLEHFGEITMIGIAHFGANFRNRQLTRKQFASLVDSSLVQVLAESFRDDGGRNTPIDRTD